VGLNHFTEPRAILDLQVDGPQYYRARGLPMGFHCVVQIN
jgi:hypothetical protein